MGLGGLQREATLEVQYPASMPMPVPGKATPRADIYSCLLLQRPRLPLSAPNPFTLTSWKAPYRGPPLPYARILDAQHDAGSMGKAHTCPTSCPAAWASDSILLDSDHPHHCPRPHHLTPSGTDLSTIVPCGGSRRCFNLGSYNYLGFAANDPYCTPRVVDTIRELGVSSSSARAHAGGGRHERNGRCRGWPTAADEQGWGRGEAGGRWSALPYAWP